MCSQEHEAGTLEEGGGTAVVGLMLGRDTIQKKPVMPRDQVSRSAQIWQAGSYLNFDWMIKHLCARDQVLMGLPMLDMHHLFARDDVTAQIARESIPDLEVGDRCNSVWRTREPASRPGLWPVLQRIQDGAPVGLAVMVMLSHQMLLQGATVNADLAFCADRDLPGLRKLPPYSHQNLIFLQVPRWPTLTLIAYRQSRKLPLYSHRKPLERR